MTRNRLVPTAIVLVATLATVLAGCTQGVGGPVPREVAEYSIEDFMGTTSYRGASFSPDKSKILVSSDETGILNAFALPVDGSDPVRLTDSTVESIFAVSYFPGDERFLYSADEGGNELNHLYVHELDGSSTDLTPGEQTKAQFLGWSHDEQSFFVGTNERDPRFFDVYEYAVDGYARELVFRNDSGFMFADVSPDKRYLAFTKSHTRQDSDIFIYDRETAELKHITLHEGQVSNSAQTFSPDGGSFFYSTDEDSEFKYLVRYDLASGEREVFEKPEWDVAYATFSKSGKYMVIAVNNDARTEIRLYDATNRTRVALPEMPQAEITSLAISKDEQTIAFYASSSREPRDLYVYDIGGAPPRKLTQSLNENIEAADLVDGKVVRFESYDGLEIPGILYRPHNATPDNKAPALVQVHGGPGGQSRVGYRALTQYLVNHGYVVYAINNRGSSGYGKTFFELDDRKHGEADLKDCIASKQMLIDTGYVDAERIGIIGGSYGGYMVLAALAFAPEEFEVGVDIFGVANWVRTLEKIPPYWEAIRPGLYKEMGDPATDGERLRRISPLFHAGNITKPLIVLQGANDPRVLKIESDEMVEAARANGATVEYVVFDDEGHGFRKKANQHRGYEAILDFLDTHLKGETEAAPAESDA
jgi:dipeptidyl aminopeptidase/acylaminoacyl peptidase